MSRVLFAGGGTGGHLYPALALADALRAGRPDVVVHFVGAQRGVEARVLPQRGEPHTLLPTEPLRRDRPWRNWRLAPSLAVTFAGLSRLFHRFRPGLVVGTGGYASGPACVYALWRNIPFALQEQNSSPGLVTRVMSRWARQVHLGFPEAERRLSRGKRTQVFAFGNPIRPPDPTLSRADCRAAFGLPADAVVLLVVGGSQGSRAINERLMDTLERAGAGRLEAPPEQADLFGEARRFAILWATGPSHLDSIRTRLGRLGAEGVKVVGYIDDMPRALCAADMALSRAGAMATAEFQAWGIPMLLVPLPTAAADHQTHNAKALEAAGAAVWLEERTLESAHLWAAILALVTDAARRGTMAERARLRSRPDAAHAIAQKLLELIEDA